LQHHAKLRCILNNLCFCKSRHSKAVWETGRFLPARKYACHWHFKIECLRLFEIHMHALYDEYFSITVDFELYFHFWPRTHDIDIELQNLSVWYCVRYTFKPNIKSLHAVLGKVSWWMWKYSLFGQPSYTDGTHYMLNVVTIFAIVYILWCNFLRCFNYTVV